MARLFIALGSPDNKPSSPVSCIYVGRDGDAMRRALAMSMAAVHIIFQNPMGMRKNNQAASANAAAEGSQGESIGTAQTQVIHVTHEDMARYEAEMQRLNAELKTATEHVASRDATIAELQAQRADLTTQLDQARAVAERNSPEKGESLPTPQTETATAVPPVSATVGESAPLDPAPRAKRK